MLTQLVSAALAAATPICPNGVVVPSADICPSPLPAADLLADNMPFQTSFVAWDACERVTGEEKARRDGRAGPGRAADYAGIGDCASEAAQLRAIVEALPTGGPREQAIAAIDRAQEQIAAMVAQVYQQHNYE